MGRKLNKLDRMGVAESVFTDGETLEDAKEAVEGIIQHIETFEESREAAAQAFQEAAQYHEEREWDSRDSSLEDAADAVENMTSTLDEIEMQGEWITLPEGRMEALRKMVEEAQDHLGHLI